MPKWPPDEAALAPSLQFRPCGVQTTLIVFLNRAALGLIHVSDSLSCRIRLQGVKRRLPGLNRD